jgi:uncharacterized protein YqeY
MLLIGTLKADITAAMKTRSQGPQIKLDLLRVVVGEIQTLESSKDRKGKPITDDDVHAVMRKIIQGNRDNLNRVLAGTVSLKLTEEIRILEEYLPVMATFDEVEAEFLNSDGPEVEQIHAEPNKGKAIGIGMRFMKGRKMVAGGKPVDGKMVTAVVEKFWDQEHAAGSEA